MGSLSKIKVPFELFPSPCTTYLTGYNLPSNTTTFDIKFTRTISMISTLNSSKKQHYLVWGILGLTIFLGLILRLPYWQIIPAPNDELHQSIVALEIANGTTLPLVGNDSYAGPFYFYFLALLIRLGLGDPLMGRMIAIITGTLTILFTYLWIVSLSKNKTAALIAALLVAVNPYLILINSHMGGTTYLLPFLSVLFFWCLTETVRRDHKGWLVATAISAGLVVQVNPVGALVLFGGFIWGAWQMRKLPKLGFYWPLWPLLLGLGIVLMYSPVIIYNLGTELDSVSEVQERSYLWETDPTIQTFVSNTKRLTYQLVRQLSGVLRGEEDLATLLGVPLLYFSLALLGFGFTTKKISALPLLLTLPFLIIFPYFSSHYGFDIVTRFTTLLIPVFTAVIGFLLAYWIGKILSKQPTNKPYAQTVLLFVIGLALIIAPLVALTDYFDFALTTNKSGKVLFELSKEAVAQNQGEPVYISTNEKIDAKGGITYLTHNYFVFANIYHEYLTPAQILGRLYANPDAATFLISDDDAAYLNQFTPLIPSESKANRAANAQNFGLYTLDPTFTIAKPDFVVSSADTPEQLTDTAVFAESLKLLGCAAPTLETDSTFMNIACYWQLSSPLPENTYVGFLHLMDAENATLISQDDHILGRDRYPLMAWQPDEIIIENYRLNAADLTATGTYELLLGVYTWPDVTRLTVPNHPENIIRLPPLESNTLTNN